MTRQLSEAAQAAKAIRQELKRAYPEHKFSVTSDNFSMGDAVRISWTDGPTVRQVEAISAKYQYSNYNVMEDLHENSNNRDDIPQAKYVQTERSYSIAATQQAVDRINATYGYHLRLVAGKSWVDPASDEHTGNGWQSQEIHRFLLDRFIFPDGVASNEVAAT